MNTVAIANPIYDSVFKYMMEDNKAAKLLIGALLNREVISLTLRNNDLVEPKIDGLDDDKLCLYRIDFAAEIKTDNGKELVTIEVQKAFRTSEIERFRKYLGMRYVRTQDDHENVQGKDKDGNDVVVSVFRPSRIIAIYILGDRPLHKEKSVIYGTMSFTDPEGKSLRLKHEMITALTHDFIAVQVPNLPAKSKIKVENFLSIFDQKFASEKSSHILNYIDQETEWKDDLNYILRRLQNAAVDDDVRKDMMEEDLAIRAYQQMLAEQAIARKELFDNKIKLAEREKQIALQDAALAQKDAALAESKKTIAEKEAAISNAIKALHSQNMSAGQISSMLGISITDVEQVINN